MLFYSFIFTKRSRRLNSHFFELLLFPFIHSQDYRITDNQMETLHKFHSVVWMLLAAGVTRLAFVFI